jgi:hypothetical protein
MTSYGDPSIILKDVRDKYLANGGKDNPEVRAWIERMIFLMLGSFDSFGIPKSLGKLLVNVVRQSRKREKQPEAVEAEPVPPVCPYCKSEMYICDGEWPRFYWDCGCASVVLEQHWKGGLSL